ncbi:MAG: thioredoxin family protein [Muribaculaceae bacterium]|nr:thioredoxin family protein [Muribaculaceae bacterium]
MGIKATLKVLLPMLALVILTATSCNSGKAKTYARSATEDTSALSSGTHTRTKRSTLLHFHADWCTPCKKIAPAVEILRSEYSPRVNFRSIDVDEDIELTHRYGIKSVPTFIFLDENGREIRRLEGGDPEQLASALDELLP